MACGYLIATRFDVLWKAARQSGKYDDHPEITQPYYGIPHKSQSTLPEDIPKYRGIDRDPQLGLSLEDARLFTEAGFPSEATEATALLWKIQEISGREDGWVSSAQDIQRVWNALAEDQVKHEIIFGKEWTDGTSPPERANYLGSDTAYFPYDCFSCICDALFFPRWHGTDEEGTLFKGHFAKLNEHGLFNTNEEALEYLKYYLSFDWTERSDIFTSIEVYSVWGL